MKQILPLGRFLSQVSRGRSSFHADSANLDLIRAVAVLSVVLSHLDGQLGGANDLIWHLGQMGVLIFFVHTSMVLMLSLERSGQNLKELFGSFYVRRIFRIYPLSITCVTLAFVFNLTPDGGFRSWGWQEYFANLSLSTNLFRIDTMVGGLWTLPLEVQMYVLLPFMYLLHKSAKISRMFALLAVAISIALLQPHISTRLNVLGYVPCFFSGVIAWRLSRSLERRAVGWMWPVAFVMITPIYLASKSQAMLLRWVFCLILGLAIPWFKELSFRPINVAAKLIAKYSYSIYLSHIAVIMWALSLHVSAFARLISLFAALTVCPLVLYHVVEHPMIDCGRIVAARMFKPNRPGGA